MAWVSCALAHEGSSVSALRGHPVDVARFIVSLAPNRPDLRLQLDKALAAAAGPLRQRALALEFERPPSQAALPGMGAQGRAAE